MKRRLLRLLTPTFLMMALLFTACESNDPDKRDTVDYEATLNSEQLVGVDRSSTATGTFIGTYNKETKVLSYTINLNGVTPTEIYIAQAQPGISNGIGDIPLSRAAVTTLTGEATLTQRQENDLIFGNYAVIVKSARYPNGDIRGNIMARKF